MALRYAGKQPSPDQVNTEFGADIQTTLNNYNQLDDYEFGDLTAIYCGLDINDTTYWKGQIAHFYTQDVRDEIKRTVDYALSQEDDQGNPAPVPIQWDWNGPPGTVTVTYHATDAPYYTISLGFRPPHSLPKASNRKK